jgi:plasmid maintenance system antidote protein VapI
LRLEKWLGVDRGGAAHLWLAQQAAYDLWVARQAVKEELDQVKRLRDDERFALAA